MTPATNAAAITMTTTQTQMEALASLLSSISITSFVAIQMPVEGQGEPVKTTQTESLIIL